MTELTFFGEDILQNAGKYVFSDQDFNRITTEEQRETLEKKFGNLFSKSERKVP